MVMYQPTYRATLEFVVSAPRDWTISDVAQYMAEEAEKIAGRIKTNINSGVLVDSVKVGGVADQSD